MGWAGKSVKINKINYYYSGVDRRRGGASVAALRSNVREAAP